MAASDSTKTKRNKRTAETKPGAAEEPKKDFSGKPVKKLWMVRKLIRQCFDEATSSKSGVAELIRLIALERELADETESIREIKVTWVEPSKTAPSKSE